MSTQWLTYPSELFYDELIDRGAPRPGATPLLRHLAEFGAKDFAERKTAADVAIAGMGITFTVYNESEGSIDRAWPFDIIPRIITLKEWCNIEAGLKQRVKALNQFIDDLYHDQHVVRDGVFPAELLANSRNFRKECIGIDPPLGIWAHVCGSDLVRDRDGAVYVLEDNLRVPSGVSYMLENRMVMKRVFPELFEDYAIKPVDDYPAQLLHCLSGLTAASTSRPQIVVLTPGIYNSAYFEHCYLAQQMGAELVEGGDLFVDDRDRVHMRTIEGPKPVDVIYRRIDDDFLDPEVFREDSMLGVPGLMRA